MTDNVVSKKLKKFVFSLRTRFLAVFMAAAAIAVLLFFLSEFLFTKYINTVYIEESNKKEREERYITDLQSYIKANNYTSEDVDKISEWARKNRYVYLLIYKDDELFYTSDDELKPPDDGESGSKDDGDGKDDKDNDDKDKENGSVGGITVKYPTREELFEYARANDLHPIDFADKTVMFASVAEFTEYLYYDIANIASLLIAAITVVGAMLIYVRKVTVRIIRLGADVNIVAEGDTGHSITAKGSDEISELAANVDSMRSSMIETFEKEREAVASNNALITSMSHDIRTPLTVLLGYMDVMRVHSEDDPMMQEYVRAAETTALRLKKLSDDMFSYFLVFGSNEAELATEDFEVQSLIEQMLSEHILLLRENGYNVQLEGLNVGLLEGKTIATDAQKLLRIFDNIFSNIYKYAEKSAPVRISISADTCRTFLEFRNEIREDTADVESNGIGLKTCKKLAELLKADFNCGTEGKEYYVNLGLQIK